MKQNRQTFLSNSYSRVVLAMIVILVSIGLIAYFRPDVNNSTSIDELLAIIKSDIETNYSDVAVENSGPGNWQAQMGNDTIYTPKGYDYSVSSTAAPGIAVTRREGKSETEITKFLFFRKKLKSAINSEIIRARMLLRLEQAGFSSSREQNELIGVNRDSLEENSSPRITTFERNKDKCDVTAYNGILQISCFGAKNLLNTAKALKPFAEAYRKTHKDQLLTFGAYTIKSQHSDGVISASKNAGYDIAEVIVIRDKTEKKIALFYQKDGHWHYITEADDEFGFSCSDIEADPDAHKAMYDQICYDYQKDSGQRRVDSSRPALQE